MRKKSHKKGNALVRECVYIREINCQKPISTTTIVKSSFATYSNTLKSIISHGR